MCVCVILAKKYAIPPGKEGCEVQEQYLNKEPWERTTRRQRGPKKTQFIKLHAVTIPTTVMRKRANSLQLLWVREPSTVSF